MYQQGYNYYSQQPYSSMPRQPSYNPTLSAGLKGRPVSSVEEARAASIDFDGSIFYFPDMANNCIYTKQINMDGSASINVYELQKAPLQLTPNIDTASFITREEFEQVMQQLRSELIPQQKNISQLF